MDQNFGFDGAAVPGSGANWRDGDCARGTRGRPILDVLIVDDEPNCSVTLKTCLAMLAYRVDVADDGEQAMKFLCSHRVRLILVNVFIADGNGLSLLVHLKNAVPHLPVIAVAGHGQRMTRHTALRFGAKGVVQKPFTLQELLSAIGREIGHPPSRNPRATN